MEPTTLSILPVKVVSKFSTISRLEQEDRNIIETIAKRIQTVHPSSYFSSKTLPSRVLLKFFNIEELSVADLRKINISTHRVKDISIDMLSKGVTVELKRETGKRTAVKTIKRRQPKQMIDKDLLKETVSKFLSGHAKTVREEDKRLIRAVLECIMRWTWNTTAAEVLCKAVGDNYEFSILHLQKLTLSQLETLCDLGEYVQDIRIQLQRQMVQFLVLRTNSYIQNGTQVKRRKLNE